MEAMYDLLELLLRLFYFSILIFIVLIKLYGRQLTLSNAKFVRLINYRSRVFSLKTIPNLFTTSLCHDCSQ
jgi:hypothetical protein